ncbi:PLU-1-like protein-domain-containing protein [Linnemannia elongata]|nr:PLU-1-like protein-domain-containing protein [Linnemannia elongata]
MMKQAKHRPVQATHHKAPALDLSTVATNTPPENASIHPPTRIFGLVEAPCFYPTAEQFIEPLKYIESIRPEAEKAGICKIIPPAGWKPTFALDTEVFRFKTRIQKLNSMEGETRTNLNYLEQLYKFHSQQGQPVLKIPQLDKRPIDLFRLKKEVAARGGYQKVTSGKKWAEIGRGLDYTRKQCTSLSNALKSAYIKVILPYEIYLSKQAKLAPEPPAQDAKKEPLDTSSNGKRSSPSIPPTTSLAPETRKSKRIKKDPVSYADSEPSSPSHSDRMSSEPGSVKREDTAEESSDVCEICHTERDLDKMLICDGCELGYHMYCLTPPLNSIPKTDWYCAKCLVAGDEFGFEEGEEYSLSSFQQKCNTFKKNWFEKAGYTDGRVPEDAVEREFWRLVESTFETVEVEYGADLHSTQHGSGFPSLERNPNDKYSTHPSNLNNMPVLPESLFCHIKSDISGMMVPWLYVGMCFSTFCWHNEDHYTYSVNYMHWGETKTWYGVPASDALKFEDTMRRAVPELFEQQPDLLFQLVTMLSPERLVANGVKVLALDQRPGQFVVTFPQAYHAGFNHGFNFAEAVNFAPPDWCKFGLECVQRYKEHRKHPVFSHDELILTTALNDPSIATAYWLKDGIQDLFEREISQRRDVKKECPNIKVSVEEADRPEEEVQCLHCNTYIYLSQIGCQCQTKVVCPDHISELCKCDSSKRLFRLRYSDDRLKEIRDKIVETAAIPDAWTQKYRTMMMETRTPSLKLLRSLLAEADRIPFPIKEAGHLRKFVAEANDWVEATTKVLVRKHHQGRRLLERAHGTSGKRLEDLQDMLRRVERMRFDCPEIKQLEDSIDTILEYRDDVRRALNKPEHDLNECRELYEIGVSMNIGMDEIDQLETIVKDLIWIERAHAKGVDTDDYHLICSLVADARKSGVSLSNPLLKDLIEKEEEGHFWEDRAQAALNRNPVDLVELQDVIRSGQDIPVSRAILSKAEHLYNKSVDWAKSSDQLVERSGEPEYEDRPSVSELKRALKLAETVPIEIAHKSLFEEESRKFDDWMAWTQSLFLQPGSRRSSGFELEESLEDLKENVQTCTMEEKIPPILVTANGILESQKADKIKNGAGYTAAPDVEVESGFAQPTGSPSGEVNGVPPAKNGNAESAHRSYEAPLTAEEVAQISNLATKTLLYSKSETMDPDREEPIYCLCRNPESGMMVECDECHEWYHGTCVRVTKREASLKSNYICPVCNLSLVIRRDRPRPTLDELARCFHEGQSLRFYTPEVPLLGEIFDLAARFQQRVDRFLHYKPIMEEDIGQVKAYLRKIEGMDIELREEREALRGHVLRLCPDSMPVPVVMLSNYPTAPPMSTISNLCLCRKPFVEAEAKGNDGAVLVQCGGCQDWHHIHCVGLHLEQAQRLNRFYCPVCTVLRKKTYQYGALEYHDEVQARAAERIQYNKDQAELRRKRRKSSKDEPELSAIAHAAAEGDQGAGSKPSMGIMAGPVEERKKRPYKKRDPLAENGDKPKPKRRKSIVQSMHPAVTNGPMPPSPSAPGSGSGSTVTPVLPSFSEGFLLPHDRRPHDRLPSLHQQHPHGPPPASHSHGPPPQQHSSSRSHPPPLQSHHPSSSHPSQPAHSRSHSHSHPHPPPPQQQQQPHPHAHTHVSHQHQQHASHSHPHPSHPHPHQHSHPHSHSQQQSPPQHSHAHAHPHSHQAAPYPHSSQHSRTGGSHSMSPHYPHSHGPPHPSHSHHPPPSQSSRYHAPPPQQTLSQSHQRYGHSTSASSTHLPPYQPSSRDHVQLAPIHGRPPLTPPSPHSRSQSHSHSPSSHERTSLPPYSSSGGRGRVDGGSDGRDSAHYAPVQGHYPPPPPHSSMHHHHQLGSSEHHQHPHAHQQPHMLPNDRHHPHLAPPPPLGSHHHRSPHHPGSSPNGGYSSRGGPPPPSHGLPPPVLPPLKHQQQSMRGSGGPRPPSSSSPSSGPHVSRGHDPVRSSQHQHDRGYSSQLERASGVDTESDDEISATVL